MRKETRKLTGRGFTMIEMGVVLAIVMILASMLFPIILQARKKAREVGCTNNLHQIYQALVMYDTDHDRDLENYPDRVTHLVYYGYAPDERIFICPADSTGAIGHSSPSQNTLKPGAPKDNFSNWAERANRPYQNSDNDDLQHNCSYSYEFSTRAVLYYDESALDWDAGKPTGTWWADYLTDRDISDPPSYYELSSPFWDSPCCTSEPGTRIDEVSRFHKRDGANPSEIVICWQEAKFWQLQYGDTYVNGIGTPGDGIIPDSWTDDPWQAISVDNVKPLGGYPRTYMPMLRCFWHCNADTVDSQTLEQVLNLSLDGSTFYSVAGWEQTAWKYGVQEQLGP